MAQQNLNTIRGQHADLLQGLQNQQVKFQNYKQQKALEKQQTDQMQREQATQLRAEQADAQKPQRTMI